MSLNRDAVVKLLKEAAKAGATEVHFKVPSRPLLRIDDALTPTSMPPVTPRDAQEAVFALCSLAQKELPVATITDEAFSFGLHGVGRFRAYIYRQRGSLSAVVQRVNTNPPALYEIGVDAEVERHVGKAGLLLLCGEERHALLGALVSGYNARDRGHAVVLESPLNYLYRDAVATIAQREVGTDVPDFRTGIRQAMRVGADLLVIGEIEDADTAEAVLTACENGLAVISTVAAPMTSDAIWWVERLFFSEARVDIRRRLEHQTRALVAVHPDKRFEISTPDTT